MHAHDYRNIAYYHRDNLARDLRHFLSRANYLQAALIQSPLHFINAYRDGLNDVAERFQAPIPLFLSNANLFISEMNKWGMRVNETYISFAEVMKDPEFSVGIHDLYTVYEYSQHFSVVTFAKDLISSISKSFFHAQHDLKAAAGYLTDLHEFEEWVEDSLMRVLWPSLLSDTGH